MTDDNRDMIDGFEGLRLKLNQEHISGWQAAVQSAVSEIYMAAAEQVILRAEATRTRLFKTLIASAPEPALPAPQPIYSEPTATQPYPKPACTNGHYYDDDLADIDMPKVFGGRA